MEENPPAVVVGCVPKSRTTMKPLVKVGLVGGGYVIAGAVAAAAVACHLLMIGGSASQADGGMAAFGDFLLFIAVFGVAAVIPTGAALYFLRPHPAFWRWYSVVALVFAISSLAAFIAVTFASRSMVGGVAFLRILVAPLFTIAFLLSGLFAPNRAPRIALLIATAIEATGFAGWLIACLLRNR